MKAQKVTGWVRSADEWHKASTRELIPAGPTQRLGIKTACGKSIGNPDTWDNPIDAAPRCSDCK